MRLAFATLLAVASFSSAAEKKDDFAEIQKKELQGTWVVTGSKGYPKEMEKELASLRLTIKGDAMSAQYAGKSAAATYKLVLTKAGPSQMDVAVTEGPEKIKGKTVQTIYLLEGGTLKFAFREPGKPRITDFTDESQPGVLTVSFKKEKAKQ
jgi:uncharacterized protein (TIGR03067 family)